MWLWNRTVWIRLVASLITIIILLVHFSNYKITLKAFFDPYDYYILVAYQYQWWIFELPKNNCYGIDCIIYIAALMVKNLLIKIQIFTFNTLDFFGLVISERLQYSTFSELTILAQHTTSELILNPIIFFQRGYSKIPFIIIQCFFQKAYAIFIIFWHDNIRIYLWRFQSLAQYLDMRVHILRFSLWTQNLA